MGGWWRGTHIPEWGEGRGGISARLKLSLKCCLVDGWAGGGTRGWANGPPKCGSQMWKGGKVPFWDGARKQGFPWCRCCCCAEDKPCYRGKEVCVSNVIYEDVQESTHLHRWEMRHTVLWLPPSRRSFNSPNLTQERTTARKKTYPPNPNTNLNTNLTIT